METKGREIAGLIQRAVRAPDELIPPTVFIPVALRRSTKFRVGKKVVTAMSPQQVADEITRAEPHKFLIAVMEGRPLPAFVMTKEGRSVHVDVEYVSPSVEDRITAATALVRKMSIKRPGERDAEYNEAMARAAAQAEAEPLEARITLSDEEDE